MDKTGDDQPSLVATSGPLDGQRWILKSTLIIGRDESCEIIIPDRQVSRHHARLTLDERGTYIEDLGSKNGTHINGSLIDEPALLNDGDVIQIAVTQQFLYLSSDATLPLDGIMPAGSIAVQAHYRSKKTPGEDSSPHQTVPSHRGVRLDQKSHRVWVNDIEIDPPLSVSQFQLLELLFFNHGKVVARPDVINYVWGEEVAAGVSEQALDALVRRLRDRLATLDPTHNYILTIRGHGLRLDNPLQSIT
jgi:DNA-binding winged helix-turn-helix (wHTH) protein